MNGADVAVFAWTADHYCKTSEKEGMPPELGRRKRLMFANQ